LNLLYHCFQKHQDLFTLITLTALRVLKEPLGNFDQTFRAADRPEFETK